MIEIRDLSVELGGRTVLDAVSLTLNPGRITAIVGPNGAGKSSLVRAIVGLIPLRSGSVLLDGTPIGSIPPAERACRIGYLPQDGEPAWNVTARELVALGRLPHRSRFAAPSVADVDAVDAALDATDTVRFAGRTMGTLSGGEKARVKMARVLAGQPDWILADEPLANLDPPHQRDMIGLLRNAASAGKGAVAVLHQLDAAGATDDVVMLKDGRLVAHGPSSAVLTAANLETTFGMAFDIFPRGDRVAILPLA